MATYEEIKQELIDAKTRLDEATKKLDKWEEGKKQERLDELERKLDEEEWRNDDQKERWEESVKKLEKEKEELKKDKSNKWERVGRFQDALLEFGKEKEGVVEKNKGVKRKPEEDTWNQAKAQKTKIGSMKSPSTYCKIHEYDPDVMCNYRPNGSNIPISIYNRIFGNFKDRLSAKEVNIGNYKIGGEGGVIEYLERLAKVYSKEDERKSVFRGMMHDLLGYEMHPFSITGECTADGAILYTVGGGQRALLILEAKNEIGSGGDPHRQACGSYGKYLPMVPNCERYLNPCFLLYLAGPWLGISGAVFGEDIIIEPLTPLIPLVPILCHHNHIINILVMFDALKAGLTELKTYYNSVKPDKLDIERQSHFPYPHSFKSNNKDYQFIYKKQLYKTKLLFLVEEVQENNTEHKIPQQWVVKFVQNNYGQEVHEYCYQKKLAPRLFAVQDLCDNWKMVVMEYLLPDKFESLDSYVSNLQYNEKEKIKGKVLEVVKILHDENYVHGDLRLINMMISITNLDEFELRIVDFDWSGRDSNVKYPLLINSEVSWHQDVTGGAPIKKEHDIHLLKNGFKSLGFEILD